MNSTEAIARAILAVPEGKVASYARIASEAGIPRGARQVARVLHSSSGKRDLPWWRIVRSSGEIALSPEAGGSLQKELLLREGVAFRSDWVVDLKLCGDYQIPAGKGE
ncbi:MAG: MGMT family protein [Candidatus Cloacimonetes bacterium]|nr:MGMT family protein [Candidatus Cloacimonadota bacterium]